MLDILPMFAKYNITTFCAPPTVWRMLIQADLTGLANPPTKVVGPLTAPAGTSSVVPPMLSEPPF